MLYSFSPNHHDIYIYIHNYKPISRSLSSKSPSSFCAEIIKLRARRARCLRISTRARMAVHKVSINIYHTHTHKYQTHTSDNVQLALVHVARAFSVNDYICKLHFGGSRPHNYRPSNITTWSALRIPRMVCFSFAMIFLVRWYSKVPRSTCPV